MVLFIKWVSSPVFMRTFILHIWNLEIFQECIIKPPSINCLSGNSNDNTASQLSFLSRLLQTYKISGIIIFIIILTKTEKSSHSFEVLSAQFSEIFSLSNCRITNNLVWFSPSMIFTDNLMIQVRAEWCLMWIELYLTGCSLLGLADLLTQSYSVAF